MRNTDPVENEFIQEWGIGKTSEVEQDHRASKNTLEAIAGGRSLSRNESTKSGGWKSREIRTKRGEIDED
jgi:hypothetical protein